MNFDLDLSEVKRISYFGDDELNLVRIELVGLLFEK